MKKKNGITIVGIFITLLLIMVALGVALVQKYTSNTERVTAEEAFPVAEGEAHVIFWQEKYEKNALLLNGGIYLDYETVYSRINKNFYYDEEELVLTYTTPTEVIRAYPMEVVYYSNKEKKELTYEPLVTKGGKPYVSLEFMAMFSDMTYTFYEKPARVLIRTGSKEMLELAAQKDTVLRESADIKSRIISDLSKDSVLWYVDAGIEAGAKFVKVMTKDGTFGFVRKKDLSETYHKAYKSEYKEAVYSQIASDEDIVLGWHQVTNKTANANLENLIKDNKELTVISPTWFRLAPAGAETPILSLADASYVEKAKEYGLAVWGLVDNFAISEDNKNETGENDKKFDPVKNSYEVLSSTKEREKLVKGLVAEALQFGLDGLNIDFEMLTLETGPHYIQFLRELSVECRQNNLVLSVDNYVPSAHAAYYNWAAQGEVVDYVVIMAYDEHYAGSETAGSVASYSYLTNAVDNILTMVPKEKVIMAVPFYTRLWTETKEQGVTKLRSEAVSMVTAAADLARNDVTPVWDEVTRQYYAEYEKDGAVCKVWLEDTRSLQEKIAYIRKADLAGVAVWRLGFESQEVWTLFE